jgi:predicted P-loop ATPase
VLAFDENAQRIVARAAPPWLSGNSGVPFEWSDVHDIYAAEWLQHHEIRVGKEIAGQAAYAVACENCYHPIRDYLDSLEWDETPRLDWWLKTYLGADAENVEGVPGGRVLLAARPNITRYVMAVGSSFLISAVARVYEPGAKVDTCPILEGGQGQRKSTALRTLFGGDWFTDTLPDIRSKDAAIQLSGVWCVEIAELSAFKPADLAQIKMFISRNTDRYRVPYGKHAVNVPRRCVFAGTTNEDVYLKDPTGGRRFWPVETVDIDICALERDRDQLWAEAVVRYKDGEPWWFDVEHEKIAAKEQRDRYEAHPWESEIAQFIAGRESVSVPEILTKCLNLKLKEIGQTEQNTVASVLRSLGLRKYKARDGERRENRYRPKVRTGKNLSR